MAVRIIGVCLALVLLWFYEPASAQVPDGALKYKRYLKRAALNLWGLDAPTATLAAQIHQESAWQPAAQSGAGARGLAQFMPTTEEWFKTVYPQQLAGGSAVAPRWSIRAMILYMRWLSARVEGADLTERHAFALSAYNGGLGWVNKRKALSPTPTVCLAATCLINPGITAGNQRENERYSARIILELEPRYIAAGWGKGVAP